MKPKLSSNPALASTFAAVIFATLSAQAGTVATTFSFQKGDLRKDGTLDGTGASYAGVVDGFIADINTTNILSGTVTATIGNSFQSQTTPPAANGRNHVGLFSYNLTELDAFIAANTSSSSSVTVTSAVFRLVTTGGAGGSNGTISLFQTNPFTTGATWPTTDGTTPWTNPYQSGLAETQYRYTGGGSALTVNLGGTSPSSGSQTAGTTLEWTSSANFVGSLNNALGRVDKTLYLMAARALGNADGRVFVNTSTAATVDARPELVIGLSINTFSDWTGASSTSWATAGNWTTPPVTGDNVRFNSSSTTNLATVLNQDFSLNGLALTNPTGAVSIGGANSLSLGAGGVDLSTATQNLTVTAPLVLAAAQTWNVAAGRTLGISGPVTGSGSLTIFGAGKVSTSVANVLPNGAGVGNLTVNGTLDLNGNSQSMNGLNGSGTLENLAAGSATLTVGNNDAASTFSGILQNTGGALTLHKIGSGALTLTGPSTYSDGFTNDGSGNVTPNNNGAFGTGPVVSNAGTLYATATTTFANTLALNNSTLRIGGGGSKTITWNGAVTATGTSGLSADGGTAGITLGSTLDITGATFSSFANGTTNTITGVISGAGGSITVTGGTLNLTGTNTYTGATTVSAGTLRVNSPGSLSASSAVAINGTSTLGGSGTLGGSVTIATDANVRPGAASVLGTLAIGGGFDISAKASGAGKLFFQLDSLAAANDKITVGNTLTIGTGALGFNDFSFTNVGGLETGTYKLITSAGLNAGDSLDAANLVGTIGAFTATLQITGGDLELVVTSPGYNSWKDQITNGLNLRTDDADGDGFTNLQEFLFGTSPIAGNGSLVTTTTGGGNVVLRWLQRETGSTYILTQSSTLGVGSWTTAAQSPALDGDQTGAPTDYDYFMVTLPIGSGKLFYRIEGVEN